MTVGRNDMSKFTEGSWQGSFTVNNERSVRTLKPSSEQKKGCEIISSRPEFASQPLNVAKCQTQSGQKQFAQSNCRILHALYKLRQKRARKTFVVQATLKSRFTLSRAQSLLSRAMSHVWPVNT